MKCNFCKKYDRDADNCELCDFEYDPAYLSDDWSIFDLDDDFEWSHIQLLNRLNAKGITCIYADLWTDNNIAFLIGCNADSSSISRALNISEECVYNDYEHMLIIINLFQEKYIQNRL